MKIGRKIGPTGLRFLTAALTAAALFLVLAFGADYDGSRLLQWKQTAKEARESAAVKAVIVDYNRALTTAYKNKQAIALTDLATPEELRRIDRHITYIYKRDQVLVANLSDIKVNKVSIKKTQAVAETREHWTNKYVTAGEKPRVVIPSKKADYTVDYKLVKDGRRWLVSSVARHRSGALDAVAAYAGKRLWLKSYDAGANLEDVANAIVLDNGGNAIVAGRTNVSTGGAIIKYGNGGNVEWIRTFNGNPLSTAVDSSNNIYVVGSQGADLKTIKYDSSGNEVWTKTYSGYAYAAEPPKSLIAVDRQGDVCIAGNNFLIKYDSAGNEMWVKTPKVGLPELALDIDGNVYLAGGTTIKYDSSGKLLWQRDTNSDNGSIVLDSQNHVYVADARGVFRIQKLDGDGTPLWVRIFNPSSGLFDEPLDLAVDSQDNVYIVGTTGDTSQGGSATDYALLKYDPSGKQIWWRTYDTGGAPNQWDAAYAIAVDNVDNVYITGDAAGDGYDVATTIKYDSAGTQLWVDRYFGPDHPGWNEGRDIAVNTSGVFVAGTVFHGDTKNDFLTIKYER